MSLHPEYNDKKDYSILLFTVVKEKVVLVTPLYKVSNDSSSQYSCSFPSDTQPTITVSTARGGNVESCDCSSMCIVETEMVRAQCPGESPCCRPIVFFPSHLLLGHICVLHLSPKQRRLDVL